MSTTSHSILHWIWVDFCGAISGLLLVAIIFWLRKRLDE